MMYKGQAAQSLCCGGRATWVVAGRAGYPVCSEGSSRVGIAVSLQWVLCSASVFQAVHFCFAVEVSLMFGHHYVQLAPKGLAFCSVMNSPCSLE
jgi:hypothetical protein